MSAPREVCVWGCSPGGEGECSPGGVCGWGVLPASLPPLRGWGPGVLTQGTHKARHGEAESSRLAVPAAISREAGSPRAWRLWDPWGRRGWAAHFAPACLPREVRWRRRGARAPCRAAPASGLWRLHLAPHPGLSCRSPRAQTLGRLCWAGSPGSRAVPPRPHYCCGVGGRRVLTAPGKGGSPLLPEVGASQYGQQRGRGGPLHAPLLLRGPQSFQPCSHPSDHRADVSPS